MPLIISTMISCHITRLPLISLVSRVSAPRHHPGPPAPSLPAQHESLIRCRHSPLFVPFQGCCFSSVFKSFYMSKTPLIIDAWIREAQEASQWLEDLESIFNHQRPIHPTSLHSARSKLLELGVKHDRLESLLRNLPAKPILTDEDVEYRWNMLKDIQLRTKSLVSSFSAAPSPNWPRDVPAADSEECNVSPDSYDQDQTITSYPRDNIELPKPLLSDTTSRGDSSMSVFWAWKACSTILLFLALAALVFFLALLFTVF